MLKSGAEAGAEVACWVEFLLFDLGEMTITVIQPPSKYVTFPVLVLSHFESLSLSKNIIRSCLTEPLKNT